MAMLGEELFIGAVLGFSVRLIMSCLQVAGVVVAQQMGLGFVTAIDPTLGQQSVIVGNFLAMLGVTLIFATRSPSSCDRPRSMTAMRCSRPARFRFLGDVAAPHHPHRGRPDFPHRH